MLQEKQCKITQHEIFWTENVILVYEIFKQAGFMYSHLFSHGLHALTLLHTHKHTHGGTCKHQDVCGPRGHAGISIPTAFTHQL